MYAACQYYFGQLQPKYPQNVTGLIQSSQLTAAASMKVAQVVLNGVNEICLICSFRDQCQWGANMYSLPMDLIIPRTFPERPPELYIIPDSGSRIFPIPNVINDNGKIVFYLINNLCSGYSMTQFLQNLHSAFGQCFPICADNRPQLTQQLTSILEPEFTSKFETLSKQFAEMKSLQKQMADNVQMVNDASKTLGYCTTQLKEQNSVISAELEKARDLEKLTEKGVPRLEENYRNAFSFSSDTERLYWELDSCEQVAKDLHDMLYSSLNKTNTEELLDVR
ncbi:hypothetical protein WA538_005797 [Blastocystis sp. DL]